MNSTDKKKRVILGFHIHSWIRASRPAMGDGGSANEQPSLNFGAQTQTFMALAINRCDFEGLRRPLCEGK